MSLIKVQDQYFVASYVTYIDEVIEATWSDGWVFGVCIYRGEEINVHAKTKKECNAIRDQFVKELGEYYAPSYEGVTMGDVVMPAPGEWREAPIAINPWMKGSLDTVAQAKIFDDNPTLAHKLKEEAGK